MAMIAFRFGGRQDAGIEPGQNCPFRPGSLQGYQVIAGTNCRGSCYPAISAHFSILLAMMSIQDPTVIIFSEESKTISILYFASASMMTSTRLDELIFRSLTRSVCSSMFRNN